VPAPQLSYEVVSGHKLTALVLGVGGPGYAMSVELEGQSAQGLAVKVTRGDVVDRLLLAGTDERRPVRGFGVEFLGKLLWLRCRGGRPTALRWVDGHRATVTDLQVDVAVRSRLSALMISSNGGDHVVNAREPDGLSVAWPSQ
jgi:hypothetical protein